MHSTMQVRRRAEPDRPRGVVAYGSCSLVVVVDGPFGCDHVCSRGGPAGRAYSIRGGLFIMSSSTSDSGRPGFQRLQAWSWAVYAALALVVAADLCSLATGVRLHGLWGNVAGQGWDALSPDSLSNFERVESRYNWLGVLEFSALVACAVPFIVWFYRVRRNAELLAPDAHSKARAWAVWGWFVPVVFWWFPRRIALDSWQASLPRSEGDQRRPSTAMVELWWAAWLADQVLANVAGRMYERAEMPGAIQNALALMNVSVILDVVAALLAALFVHRLTRLQHGTMQGVTATPLTAPEAEAEAPVH